MNLDYRRPQASIHLSGENLKNLAAQYENAALHSRAVITFLKSSIKNL